MTMQHKTLEKFSADRNPGLPFTKDWLEDVYVNLSAVERRTATLTKRRSVKKAFQAAWLLRAVTCMDLTTLAGDDTPGRVKRLCAKARQAIRRDLLEALDVTSPFQVAAVCVYPTMVAVAKAALEGSEILVASVATGFPAGLTPLEQRLAEIRFSTSEGADEIDIVITREYVLRQNWQALYDEVKAMRDVVGQAHLKTILATGELGTLRNVYKASMVCMMAGADFIKTSTGKEQKNATLEVGLVMLRAIRDYHEQTGYHVGFKPAGGIRTAKDALAWQMLIKEELGNHYLKANLFRFGASSLLADIERQLEHFVTGRYSAAFRHPMV